jgi:hypothetical protein
MRIIFIFIALIFISIELNNMATALNKIVANTTVVQEPATNK